MKPDFVKKPRQSPAIPTFFSWQYYWEDKFDEMNANERIYYKIWLWLCYAEWEILTKPISEFEFVYGTDMKTKLEMYLNGILKEEGDLEECYQLNGRAGVMLFEWAFENLELNNFPP